MSLGWGALPLRGLLIAALPAPEFVVVVQLLGGVSAAVFGVMLPMVAAEVTRGTERFNLCMGALGLAVYGGASLSTTVAGWAADNFGSTVAFLMLSLAGLAGMLLVQLPVLARSGRPPDLALARVS
jgi:hypothetical protein